MAFRANRKGFFLTYPQSGALTKEEVAQALHNLKPGVIIDALVVVAETHEDGSPHIHATVLYKQKLNIKNPRDFDLGNIHPHIHNAPVTTGNFSDFAHYLDKEDQQPILFGRVAELLAGKDAVKRKRDDIMAEILEECTGRDDFLKRVRTAVPYEFVKFHSAFESYATKYYPEPAPSFILPEDWKFNPTPPLDQWVTENLIGPHTVLTFYLF